MTTTIKISASSHDVVVETEEMPSGNTRSIPVEKGKEHTIYIHSGLRITGIEEVPDEQPAS